MPLFRRKPKDEIVDTSAGEPLPEQPDCWALVCERPDVVLDLDMARDNGDLFDDLARQFAGEYDGWEASVR